jgi:hypothetical protein
METLFRNFINTGRIDERLMSNIENTYLKDIDYILEEQGKLIRDFIENRENYERDIVTIIKKYTIKEIWSSKSDLSNKIEIYYKKGVIYRIGIKLGIYVNKQYLDLKLLYMQDNKGHVGEYGNKSTITIHYGSLYRDNENKVDKLLYGILNKIKIDYDFKNTIIHELIHYMDIHVYNYNKYKSFKRSFNVKDKDYDEKYYSDPTELNAYINSTLKSVYDNMNMKFIEDIYDIIIQGSNVFVKNIIDDYDKSYFLEKVNKLRNQENKLKFIKRYKDSLYDLYFKIKDENINDFNERIRLHKKFNTASIDEIDEYKYRVQQLKAIK